MKQRSGLASRYRHVVVAASAQGVTDYCGLGSWRELQEHESRWPSYPGHGAARLPPVPNRVVGEVQPFRTLATPLG